MGLFRRTKIATLPRDLDCAEGHDPELALRRLLGGRVEAEQLRIVQVDGGVHAKDPTGAVVHCMTPRPASDQERDKQSQIWRAADEASIAHTSRSKQPEVLRVSRNVHDYAKELAKVHPAGRLRIDRQSDAQTHIYVDGRLWRDIRDERPPHEVTRESTQRREAELSEKRSIETKSYIDSYSRDAQAALTTAKAWEPPGAAPSVTLDKETRAREHTALAKEREAMERERGQPQPPSLERAAATATALEGAKLDQLNLPPEVAEARLTAAARWAKFAEEHPAEAAKLTRTIEVGAQEPNAQQHIKDVLALSHTSAGLRELAKGSSSELAERYVAATEIAREEEREIEFGRDPAGAVEKLDDYEELEKAVRSGRTKVDAMHERIRLEIEDLESGTGERRAESEEQRSPHEEEDRERKENQERDEERERNRDDHTY